MIKPRRIRRVCRGEEREIRTKFWYRKSKERKQLEDFEVDGS
jgi:hypothetical protein